MKPIIIVEPETVSQADIQLLRDNKLCVVVAKDPHKVKFLDPIPAVSSRTDIDNAAIQLSRRILRGDIFRDNRRDFANLFLDCLLKGTSLDPMPSKAEQEQQIFDAAKRAELERLAREEAKAERAALKLKK